MTFVSTTVVQKQHCSQSQANRIHVVLLDCDCAMFKCEALQAGRGMIVENEGVYYFKLSKAPSC